MCQAVWKDDGPGNGLTDAQHRAEGKCGEPMAAHLYYSTHSLSTFTGLDARIGTVVILWDNTLKHTNPCGDPKKDTCGCNLFVADQSLNVLDENLEPGPYDLNTLAGGLTFYDEISVCTPRTTGN